MPLEIGSPRPVGLQVLRSLWVEALLLLAHVGVVGWVVTTGRIPTNSDQAVVGLMGIHILEGRGHPVFYFGATYAGSFEAHLVALAFAVFGVSTAAFRGVMALLEVAVVLSTWGITRLASGPRAARWALLYLAIPPFFLPYKLLTSDGHYVTACLLAGATIAAALWHRARTEDGSASMAPACALGLAGGLGLWTSPVCPPFFAATVIWLGVTGARRTRLRSFLALVGGFVAGSSPWWIWNARHGWASLTAAETAPTGVPSAFRNLGLLVLESVPILLGVGVPHVRPASLVLRMAILVASAVVLLLAVRRAARGSAATSLLLWVLAAVVLVAVAPARFAPLEPRFLVCSYVLFAPLVGAAVSETLREPFSPSRAVGLFAAGGLLLANLSSLATARVHSTVTHENEVTAPIDDLLGLLRVRGVRHVWTNYWTAYRVAFESREEILATPLRGDDVVRIDGYEEAVAASPDAAVVLLPPSAACFESHLRERNAPFDLSRAGAFSVFTGLGPETLALLRGARSLPLPRAGHRVSWTVVQHPNRLEAGSQATVVLEVRNVGDCQWSPSVHLGHWWMPAASPVDEREVPERYFPSRRVGPGESFRAEFTVRVPESPGRWLVRYDLVHEGITWFKDAGGKPLLVEVDVASKAR